MQIKIYYNIDLNNIIYHGKMNLKLDNFIWVSCSFLYYGWQNNYFDFTNVMFIWYNQQRIKSLKD